MRIITRILLCLATIAFGFALTGCGTTGTVGGNVHIPDPTGGTGWDLVFRLGPSGEMYYFAEDGRKICVEIVWSDSSGATIGTSTGEIPGSGQVPAGAVRYEVREVKCPDGENGGGKAHSGAGSWSERAADGLEEFHIFGGPIVPIANGRNVFYSFVIRADHAETAHRVAQRTVSAGPGINIPPAVQIIRFAEMWAEEDVLGTIVGARLRVSDQGADIQSFLLEWNDSYGYAELGVTSNCIQFDLPGDWNCVEVFIPVDDIEQPHPTHPWRNEGNVWTTTDQNAAPLFGTFKVLGNQP